LHCANHDGVPGIGVCVDCTKVVCEACTTRLQGRNFCADCLARRAAPAPEVGGGDSLPVQLVVGVMGLVAAAALWAAATGFGFLRYLVG